MNKHFVLQDDVDPAETIYYRLDLTVDATAAGVPPTAPSVKVYDQMASWADVTSTIVVTNSVASISGNIITLPALHAFQYDHRYRVEVTYTLGSSTLMKYYLLNCTRL